MGKVSSHNGHELATAVASRPGESAEATFRWTLTSDCRILRRLQSSQGRTHTTGYRVWSTVSRRAIAAVTDTALTVDGRQKRAAQLLSRAVRQGGMVHVA